MATTNEQNLNIKDMVGGDKKVHFVYFQSGNLFYETDTGFVFPVPVSDFGDTRLPSEDKAMMFMKYIKIAIKNALSVGDEA